MSAADYSFEAPPEAVDVRPTAAQYALQAVLRAETDANVAALNPNAVIDHEGLHRLRQFALRQVLKVNEKLLN